MSQALYAAATDLRDAIGINELVQVAQPENAATPLDPTTFNTVINDEGVGATGDYQTAYNTVMASLARASALIDSRLRSVYVLPLLAPIPEILTDYDVEIARFFLHNDQATDEIRFRYTAALNDLAAVAKGAFNLGATDSSTTQIDPGLGVSVISNTRDTGYSQLSSFAGVFPQTGGVCVFNGCGCR